MFINLKIGHRVALGFGVMIVMQLILSISTVITGNRVDFATAETRRLSNIVLGAKDMVLTVRQGRVMVWSYMASGDQIYLTKRQDTLAQFKKEFEATRGLIKHPDGLAVVDAFNDTVSKFIDKSDKMLALRAAGTKMDAPEMKVAMDENNEAAKGYAESNEKLAAYFEARVTNATLSANQAVSLASWTAGLGGVMALVFGIAAAMVIGRSISRPLATITGAMNRLAEGDRTVEIPRIRQRDEIAAMAAALQVFKDNAVEADRLAEEQKAGQATRQKRAEMIEKLTGSFDSAVSSLLSGFAEAATVMEETAQGMSANAEQTTQQAGNADTATRETSNSVSTVASAAEELSASIQEIGRQVVQSTQASAAAAEEATRTDATVQKLAEGANRIGEVVQLINDIASQTNLLALNATIEAARAGDAGKGFAVVAGEVKTLANQTARATEEISGQIQSVQQVTRDAVQAIQGIVGRIDQINQIAAAVAAAVEQQSAATGEIARNVQQAAAGTEEVTRNISGVSQAAISTGKASGDVLSAARELSTKSSDLRSVVDGFLRDIRAA